MTNDVVFISLDLETARKEVGIVQLLAEIFFMDIVRHNNSKGNKTGGVGGGAMLGRIRQQIYVKNRRASMNI